MDSSSRRRASEVFEDALELPPGARTRFIVDACAGDPRLLAEVESFFAVLPKAEALFESALASDLLETAQGLSEQEIGREVGDYRLTRVIAQGGMGTVYLAERVDPQLSMQAAIKLIRPALATTDTLRRFLAERQLLADLKHPNIARLLGGGATADGLPYIVMEYVDGLPLDRYCFANHLPVEERLRLLRTVCSAVQYAHRHLVVHRDLKPSNILVDTLGEVKLLDFGIAKVLDPLGPTGRDRTLTGMQALTPRYASPEQIRGESISTASDVYSLGVILYQLLTGCLPYETDGRTPAEIERIVCTEDVPLPSALVRSRSETLLDAPPLDSRRLANRLSGDLDTIVLRALRKEPDRRYESVEQLSEDIRRHLEGLPLVARPDSPGYRVAKFVRRNSVLVVSAVAIAILLVASVAVNLALTAVIALLLVAGAGTSYALYRRADQARRIAEERTAEAEWLAYTSSLTAAEGAILSNGTDEARRQLEKAPPALRGWEWRHLWGRLDRGEFSVWKHSGRIVDIDIDPKGSLVATASVDGTVVVWDARSGENRHTFRHKGWVEGVVFTADGRQIVSAGRDQLLALWDVATGERVAAVQTPSVPTALALSREGRLVAGLRDGSVAIHDLPTLETVCRFVVHSAAVSCLDFDPGGMRLATGSWDGEVTLWSADDWRSLGTFRAHRGRVMRVAWSPDGTRLATGSADTKVTVWDAGTLQAISTYHGFEGMVGALLFDPEGRRVLAGDSDGKLLTFDAATGDRRSVLRTKQSHAAYVAVGSPDGTRVATATVTGAIVFWSWNADDIRWLIPEAPAREQNYILGAAPSPDGSLVASASRSSGVDLWETSTGRRVHHVALPGASGASCVAFSADGQRLFSAHASGAISVTDVRTMRTQHVFPAHQASPESLEPNLEGSLIITGLAVQPSGALIASASTDRTIKIWEPSGALRHELHGHEDEATGVEFSPDGNLLASHSADSTIRLWDVASARVVRVLSAHRLRVHAVAWSPTGEHLASVSTDNAVLVWDLRRGGDPVILHQGYGAMTAIAYSADGTRIAAGGMDKTIRLFDSQRRREVVRLQGHAGRIKSLRFGAADRVLVSASIDGTVGVWDIAAGPTDGQWARPANVTRGIAQSAVMQR